MAQSRDKADRDKYVDEKMKKYDSQLILARDQINRIYNLLSEKLEQLNESLNDNDAVTVKAIVEKEKETLENLIKKHHELLSNLNAARKQVTYHYKLQFEMKYKINYILSAVRPNSPIGKRHQDAKNIFIKALNACNDAIKQFQEMDNKKNRRSGHMSIQWLDLDTKNDQMQSPASPKKK